MASNISEIFNHFFSRKSASKKNSSEIVKEEFNNQTFYRSKSGRYRSLHKKRGKLSEDMFSPSQSSTSGPYSSEPLQAASTFEKN